MTKEEVLGKKRRHTLEKIRLSVTRMVVIALVVIIVVCGIVAAYIALHPPSSSPTSSPTPTPIPTSAPKPTPTPTSAPTPTPTPSPTPSPMPKTHIVEWTTMANYITDVWNVTVDSNYQVTLNNTMTVSSGDQYLEIDARNSTNNGAYIWAVWFKNATYFTYTTYIPGQFSNPKDFGGLNCNNGIVTITVTNTSIIFVGSSSFTSYVSFQNLAQIETQNGDGNFNGGELNIEVH